MPDILIKEMGSTDNVFFGELVTDSFGMLVLPRSVNREKDKIYVYRIFNDRIRGKRWKKKYR